MFEEHLVFIQLISAYRDENYQFDSVQWLKRNWKITHRALLTHYTQFVHRTSQEVFFTILRSTLWCPKILSHFS